MYRCKRERNLFKWLSEQLGKSNAILICGKIKSQDKTFIKKLKEELSIGVWYGSNHKNVEDFIKEKIDKLAGEKLR